MGWQRFGLHAVLVLCSVVMLTPMVWLMAATIKGPDDLFHYLFFLCVVPCFMAFGRHECATSSLNRCALNVHNLAA